MKKVSILFFGIATFFLLLFIMAESLGWPIEETAKSLVASGGVVGMTLSILLLISDVFLPIPSSLIMIANGALYGPWWGTLISLVGGMGAAALGYLIGKYGEKIALKWVKVDDLALAKDFFEKWGLLAVIVSRPIPLLAETVAIMAGLSGWSLWHTLLSSLAGLIPICIVYAISGAYASQSDYGILTFLLVLGMGSITWLIGRRIKSKRAKVSENTM